MMRSIPRFTIKAVLWLLLITCLVWPTPALAGPLPDSGGSPGGVADVRTAVLSGLTEMVSTAEAGGSAGSVSADNSTQDSAYPRLDSFLNRFLSESTPLLAEASADNQSAAQTGSVRVIVESLPGYETAVQAAVAAAGTLEAEYAGLLQVSVTASGLAELAENAGIRFVRRPYPSVPEVLSEGVEVVNASVWQSSGFTGSGVKIGVLDGGFYGYTVVQNQGELPSSITTRWAASLGGAGSSAHGTACAEIIYDMAPEADLYFANFASEVEFGEAVDWFIAQGVDVISCSMMFIGGGPGDGTGVICEVVDEAYAAGILWSQSAGNYAQRHWQDDFTDTDGDTWNEFDSGDEVNAVYVSAGNTILAVLCWDDEWGASSNNYDLYLYDKYNLLLASSTDVQNGNDDPYEYVSASAYYSGYYYLMIKKKSGSAGNLQLFSPYYNLDYQTAAGSISIPADSTHVMTVGAVPWSSPDSIESYSSRGPNAAGDIKPDLVFPDRVSTVVYGTSGFSGTSASAPGAAGAAALVKQAYPAYSPAEIQSYLENRAVDLGASGKDNIYGSGRLYLSSPADRLVFQSESFTLTAGEVSAAVSVELQDSQGNALNSAGETLVNLSSSSSAGCFDLTADGAFDGAPTTLTIPSGSSSALFYYRDTLAGSAVLTAAVSGLNSDSLEVTVAAGAAYQVRVESAADGSGTAVGDCTLTSGESLTVYAVSRDLYANYTGNPLAGWSLTSLTGGVTESDLDTTSGRRIVFTARLDGSAVIHPTVDSLVSVDSGRITVVQGGLDHLEIVTQPSSLLTVDDYFDTAAEILAVDPAGNPLSDIVISAEVDPENGSGNLRGTLTATTGSDGLAVFSYLGYDCTDAFKIRFCSGDAAVVSAAVGPLAPGAAAGLILNSAPGGAASVDEILAVQPVVRVEDQFGNAVAAAVVTVSLYSGSGSLRGSLSAVSGEDGLAVFTDLGYSCSGETFRLEFTSGSLSLISDSLGPLAAGAPASLSIYQAAESGTSVDDPLAVQPVLLLSDQYANPVPEGEVTVDLAEGSGTLRGTLNTVSGSDGLASFSDLGYSRAGEYFSLVYTCGSLSVTGSPLGPLAAGAVAALSLAVEPLADGTVDDNFTVQPVILVLDQYANPVAAGLVTASLTDTQGSLRGVTGVFSDAAGRAVFTDLGYSLSGVSFSLTFSSGEVVLTSGALGPLYPGAACQIAPETASDGSGSLAGPVSVLVGSSLTVYGVARDQFGNYVANPENTTWSLLNLSGGVTEADLSALSGAGISLTGHQAGSAQIHTAYDNLTALDSRTIFVNLLPPAELVLTEVPAAGLTVDEVFAVPARITVLDAGATPLGGIEVTAALSSGQGTLTGTLTALSDASGSVVFDDLGYTRSGDNFTLSFTAENCSLNGPTLGPLAAGAAVSTGVETAADGSGSLVPAQKLTLKKSLTVYAVSRDQYDNYVANQAGQWSLAEVSGSVQASDLQAAADNLSAVFSATLKGSAVIRVTGTGLTSRDSGVISVVAASTSSGGGGGGSSSTTSTSLILSGLVSSATPQVDASGYLLSTVSLAAPDGGLVLDIPGGTRLLTATGSLLTRLTVTEESAPPAAPEDLSVLRAWNLGPEGAGFSPYITLTLVGEPAGLPDGVSAADLRAAYYDGTQWQLLEGTSDATGLRISLQITHFSRYALLVPVPETPVDPEPAGPAADTPSVSQTPAQTPTRTKIIVPAESAIPPISTPDPDPEVVATAANTEDSLPSGSGSEDSGLPFSLLVGIAVALLAVLVTLVLVVRRRR